MTDQLKSPRGESPTGDGAHPGQEPARSAAPETGERASNHPGDQGTGKTGAPGKYNRGSKGTGALINRITGILMKAAEEAPGDPVIPSAGDSPAAPDPRQPDAEQAGEKNFLESLHSQPRRGTGQLRIMVTGMPRDPEEKPAAGEDEVETPSRPGTAPEVTGRLGAPFTGVLRHTDGLSELRAEIEAEEEQPGLGMGSDPVSSAEAIQQPSESDEDMDLLKLLLSQREKNLEEMPIGAHSPALEQGAEPELADLMKQIWGESPSVDEDARLEDRFAMLGSVESVPPPPAPEIPPEPEHSAGPHFDDAVMFPDEQTPPPFAEPVLPGFAEPGMPAPVEPFAPPAAAVSPEAVMPPLASTAPEVPEDVRAAAQPEPEKPSVKGGKIGKRSETIYDDLRQTLAEEEAAKRRRRTGGLLHRITGSLRRSTDSLRKGKTGPVGQAEQPESPMEEVQISGGVEAAADLANAPDFSGFDFNDDTEELPAEPTLAGEENSALPEDALLAGLDSAGRPVDVEPVEEDWMTAIRQEGVEEQPPAAEQPQAEAAPTSEAPLAVEPALTPEPAPSERPRTITGKLAKIVTGILGGQAARKKTTKELDIPDEVVTGRLQRSMVTGPLNGDKTRELNPEDLQDLEAGQRAATEEAASTEAPHEEENEEPQNRGITGQLRSFITGILRSSEPPGTTGPLQTGDLSEISAADRVEPIAPTRQRSTPRRTSERRETFDAQSLRNNVIDDPIAAQPREVTEEELLRGLGIAGGGADMGSAAADADEAADLPQDRFGMLFGDDTVARAYSPSGETGGLENMVETSIPQGTDGNDDLNLEDIWGSSANQSAVDARQPEETIWYVPEEEGDEEDTRSMGTGSLFDDQLTEDALVAAFLSGQTGQQKPAAPAGDGMSAPDLRAIALEHYDEDEAEAAPAVESSEAGEEALEFEAEEAPAAGRGLWGRIASLTVLQKILLAEVVLLVVLVPFLVFAALTAPKAEKPAIVFPMPQALPEGVPYPTGLTLTGGWHFDLQKSTFVEGKWTPTGSEWLEGTEVRRVVALPWNKQTDAVVRTFQMGDSITLTLSNQDEVQYKITSIERRASTEADFLADRKMSLVILLYDEDSTDRWVITGEH